jgi:GNAT superfamily N-acetyltransferase
VSEDLVVRATEPDDLLGVLAVHANRDPGGPAPDRATAAEQAAWDETVRRDGLTVYLALLDGEPVGTATLIVVPTLTWLCAPTAFVEAVVVDHRHRRRGIASTILTRLFDDARAAGVNKVQLLSHKRHADDGAHALYAGLDFAPEAEGFRRYLIEHPRPPVG